MTEKSAAVESPAESGTGFDVLTAQDPAGEPINLYDETTVPGATEAYDQPDAEADDSDPAEGIEDTEAEADADQGDDESTDEADEWEVIEINGEQFTVPAKLKDGYLRQADYTRKTQEVAEQRREAEALRAEIDRRAQQLSEVAQTTNDFSAGELRARSDLQNIESELGWYEQHAADIAALANEDPVQAQQYEVRRLKLIEARRHAAGFLQSAQAQRQHFAAQEIEQRKNETWKWGVENIPDFDRAKWEKLSAFASNFGADQSELTRQINPTVLQLLDLAYEGKQVRDARSQQKQPSKSKSTKRVVPPKAGLKARSNPSPEPNLDTSSIEEYLAARAKA